MYKQIKVQAPAKINLTLEVLNKREDGFHNIKSIMQAVSLYDFLTFKVKKADKTQIHLSGNSSQIPYDAKNLVWRAVDIFLKSAGINAEIDIYIEKNIPIEAGLAGGSTDAAAAFYAMNKLFDGILSQNKIEELCASLGSDLNFCLHGGTALCSSKGENIRKIPTPDLDVTLIKPTGFGISAKEAYTKFSKMSDEEKIVPNNTEKLVEKLMQNSFDNSLLYNSLEQAVINDYPELLEIKHSLPLSMMSGSGPTFFILKDKSPIIFDDKRFTVIESLKTVSDGINEVC